MFFPFRLTSMTEVHRRHQTDADRCADELMESSSEIDRISQAIPDLEERHKFFQNMRGYVSDYCECYNEKVRCHFFLVFSLSFSASGVTLK